MKKFLKTCVAVGLTTVLAANVWAADIKEVVGFAPNYPLVGDTDLKISKAYGMLPASTAGTSPASRRIP